MQTQFGYFNTIVIKDISYCLSMQSLTEPQVPVDLTSGGCRGARDVLPAGGSNSFNFMLFLGKFGKIVCWCSPKGWRPHLGEILNPPLLTYEFSRQYLSSVFLSNWTYHLQ